MILSEEIMNESSTYRWLKETATSEGLAEGLKAGLEQGREQGREQALRDALLQTLTVRFGDVSPARRQRIAKAKLPRLERLFRQALTASTLAEALK